MLKQKRREALIGNETGGAYLNLKQLYRLRFKKDVHRNNLYNKVYKIQEIPYKLTDGLKLT